MTKLYALAILCFLLASSSPMRAQNEILLKGDYAVSLVGMTTGGSGGFTPFPYFNNNCLSADSRMPRSTARWYFH